MTRFVASTLAVLLLATAANADDAQSSASKKFRELVAQYEEEGGARLYE